MKGAVLNSSKKPSPAPHPLSGVVVDEKQGILKAYDERFLLIPVSLIHSIEDRLAESFGPVTATSFQYEIGREGGARYIRLAQKAGLSIRKTEDIQKIADRLGTLAGWGRLSVVNFDFHKETRSDKVAERRVG